MILQRRREVHLRGRMLHRGADSPNRTDDLPLTRRLLYQLSYAGTMRRSLRAAF